MILRGISMPPFFTSTSKPGELCHNSAGTFAPNLLIVQRNTGGTDTVTYCLGNKKLQLRGMKRHLTLPFFFLKCSEV